MSTKCTHFSGCIINSIILFYKKKYIYKGLTILSRYCSCQDLEFRSAMETSSVDIDKLLSKNFFLWIQCPKISLLWFNNGADLRMESFSCKQSPHTLLLGANGFTLLTTCHLILKFSNFNIKKNGHFGN